MTKVSSLGALFSTLAAGATLFAGVAGAAPSEKVLICHGTASEPNPYALIEVDVNGLNGHLDGTLPGHGPNNHADIYPAPAGGCPTEPPGGGGEE